MESLEPFQILHYKDEIISLDLRENNLNQLHFTNIANLARLDELNLAENFIKSIFPAEAPIKHLKFLNLSGNLISDLNNNTFDGLVSLKTLDLSDNDIKDLTVSFSGMAHLSKLKLNNNQLQRNRLNH
jgi:Leucine-rich repeat (LRR) protein